MIDRFAPLRLLVVIVLLLTPVWRWFSTARLSWLYLVVLACALAEHSPRWHGAFT